MIKQITYLNIELIIIDKLLENNIITNEENNLIKKLIYQKINKL